MDRIANPATRKKSDAAPQSLSPPAASQSALPTTPPLDPPAAAASTAKLERPSTIVKMKPLPLVQVASKERRSLTFEAIEMHITDPKLTFLGDGAFLFLSSTLPSFPRRSLTQLSLVASQLRLLSSGSVSHGTSRSSPRAHR